jgi:hypothetical protein
MESREICETCDFWKREGRGGSEGECLMLERMTSSSFGDEWGFWVEKEDEGELL